MRRERAEAAIIGVALISLVAFIAFGVVLAVTYGLVWLLT